MLSFAAFKALVYAIFGVAWASVLYIFIKSIGDVHEWFSSHKK